MSIVCDTCGKVANAKGCPPDMHWFQWIMDQRRGKDAMVTMPNEEGEIGTHLLRVFGKDIG